MMLSLASPGASFYPLRLEDPKAVYLTQDRFHVRGDGVADDTDGIQRAIDAVSGQGIVFVPEGRYRLTNTIVVPPGVRVFGYGARRPTFLLAAKTPGFQDAERLMVFFSGRRGGERPECPAGARGGDFGLANDANPGTFYSAMSNVDLEIGEGNPAAVGVRGRYAQHCYLAHIDFRLSSGLAGIHDIGNIAEDLRFFGGEYGIITRTPSPGWQFTLLDSHFEGQTKAAILTRTTGMTLIRPSFKSVPTAVEADIDHSEQLWIKDGLMEDVTGPAIVVSREGSLRTQINVEDVWCKEVPTFVRFRESGKTLSSPPRTGGEGSGAYAVRALSHGLRYNALSDGSKFETVYHAEPFDSATPVLSDVTPLPAANTWANLRELGAKGDGTTDDTAVLRDAIAKHRTIYLPQGHYRVTDTIELRPDTVLVGLNPITTQIVLKDGTAAFAGSGGRLPFPGDPKPLLRTPSGGTNVVTGIGLDTGGNNPSAVGALWQAGWGSMMDDVKFIGGHGSNAPVYNVDHTSDPDPARRWDSQYPSLWVTDGGGGTFKNIWTASTFASAGMLVSDTSTEGRVYQMSSEHHVRHEIQVRNAANWSFIALQTEEERGESSFALPLEIERSHDITIANLNMYRVVSVVQPFPTAVRVNDSHGIRFRGVHCYSNSKASFDNLLIADGQELRQREFASLDLALTPPLPLPKVKGAVVRLATGFANISGGVAMPNGDFCFVDARWHRIIRYDAAKRVVTTVSDMPLSPVNLVADRSGNLMVVSYAGKGAVYRLGKGEASILKPVSASPQPGATAYLPVTDWIIEPDLLSGKRPWHFVSPDGSTFLPVPQTFVDGSLTWGVKLMDTIRSFGLAPAAPRKPFYITEESGMRTYVADVAADGSLSNPRLFCEQGGESVTVGPDGRVYVAAGQVYVYSPQGRLLRTINVPERPTQLAFSGKTLYICARTSLYAVRG